MADIQKLIQGKIDFKGQALAELISQALLIVTATLSFIAGFVNQDIYQSVVVFLGGSIIVALVVLPPWPFYNQNPPKWQPKANRVKDD